MAVFVLSAARLAVAAPLHNQPFTNHSLQTFLFVGDANGGDGGNGGSGSYSPGGLAAMEEITAPAVTGMAAVMITALATAPLTVMVPETVTVTAVAMVVAAGTVVAAAAAVRNQAAESN